METNMIEKMLENLIKKALKTLGIDGAEDLNVSLKHPEVMAHGDYSTNIAMVLAKKKGQNPRELAEKIKEGMDSGLRRNDREGDMIEKVEVAGPGFINFYLAKEFFENGVGEILKKGEGYGRKPKIRSLTSRIFGGSGEPKIVVEYSSPNIAKPFTIGHLRSTIIGDAIANILEFSGHEVIRDNHLGDWGTQFGKLIVALKKWSNIETVEKSENPIRELVALYVKFHDEAEKNPSLEDEARASFTNLEKGDKGAKEIWQKCINLSLVEFNKIYKTLGVKFDTTLGESFFNDKMVSVLSDVKKLGIAKESEGAYLVFFENDKLSPMMLLKKDGSSVYALRDLAADKWRKNKYGKDTIIVNEVGTEQELYFRQLFETEKLLGYIKEGERVHVKHGMYRFKEGKMSTRKGNVIWLEEVIAEAIEKAGEINKETAEIVALGALKFNDLKRESSGDIDFDWNEILNLKGDSGPYLQYSYVRAKSILEKAKEEGIKAKINEGDSDKNVLEKLLLRFTEVVERAGREYSPHYLATYLIELASAFSTFYAEGKIVDKNDKKSSYKIALTEAFSIIMKRGLNLLGIKVPEKM